jgi:Inhibitor of Apoptosis domain
MNKDCVDSVKKYSVSIQSISDDEYFEMYKEKCRLESFVNWPKPFISVRELASNGFYYTGYGDVVECNFCRLRLHKWLADDDVEEQHVIHAPYCPLLVNPKETANEEFIRKLKSLNNLNGN